METVNISTLTATSAAPRAAWVWLWGEKLITATDHVAGNAALQNFAVAVNASIERSRAPSCRLVKHPAPDLFPAQERATLARRS